MIHLIAAETNTTSKPDGGKKDAEESHDGSGFAETVALLGKAEGPALIDDFKVDEFMAFDPKSTESDELPNSGHGDMTVQDPEETTNSAAVIADRKSVDVVGPTVGKDVQEYLLRVYPKPIDGEPAPSMDRTPKFEPTHHSDRKSVSSPSNAQSVVEGMFPKSEQVKLPVNTQIGAVPEIMGLEEVHEFKVVFPRAYRTSDILKMELPALPQDIAKLDKGRSDWSKSSSRSVRTVDSESATANLASSLASLEIPNQFAQIHLHPSSVPEDGDLIEVPGQLTSIAVPGERVNSSAQMTSNIPATQGSEVARQVAGQLAIAARPGQATEISLNPEDLGRVRMSMTTVDTTITLNIAAERPETAELLRRHIEILTQEFVALGFEDVSFSFDHQNRPDSDSESLGVGTGVIEEIADGDVPGPAQKTHPDSGLDLRL